MAPQLLTCVVSPLLRCVTVGVGDSCIKSISVIFFDETMKCRLNQNSRLQPDKAKGGVNGSRIKVKNAGRYGFSFDRGRRLDYIAGVGKIGYAVFLPAYKKRECVGGLCPVQHVQPLPLCPCRAKPITRFQIAPKKVQVDSDNWRDARPNNCVLAHSATSFSRLPGRAQMHSCQFSTRPAIENGYLTPTSAHHACKPSSATGHSL